MPEGWKEKPAKLRQKDTDARWAKKNNETHYGYKNHIKCDAKTKLIRRYRASQANLHDSQCFGELLDEGDHTVWADSAYRSKESLRMLRGKKLKARLCAKGTKAKALTPGQKRENRRKSRTGARVEHVFAHQAHLMKADCIRTIGIMRATIQIGLGNLVYNFIQMAEVKAAAAMRKGIPAEAGSCAGGWGTGLAFETAPDPPNKPPNPPERCLKIIRNEIHSLQHRHRMCP